MQAATQKSFPAGSNTTSVAEDNVLRILLLQRNFLPAHQQILDDKWDVPAVASKAHDLIEKTVGTVGGGAIGYETMKRLRVGCLSTYQKWTPACAWAHVLASQICHQRAAAGNVLMLKCDAQDWFCHLGS